MRAFVRDPSQCLSPNFDEFVVGNLADQDALMRLADGADVTHFNCMPRLAPMPSHILDLQSAAT